MLFTACQRRLPGTGCEKLCILYGADVTDGYLYTFLHYEQQIEFIDK